ncbi:MAG TPA: MinD/ParA family protein [Chloroflexota bacterium]|nr:MinD/ParA family protein [Chloroflexota bacterium]
MAQIVAVHSFRGGTGKSNTTANISAMLAASGQRTAVIDCDIQSPGIHVLFGLGGKQLQHSLNEYLRGECSIEQAAVDVAANVGLANGSSLHLIPSSLSGGEIARVIREGYDFAVLHEGLLKLVELLRLHVLIIDTHPGMNAETLLSLATADVLLLVMRADEQDYLGTAVAVEVARQLGVPRIEILVNNVPLAFDPAAIRRQVEQVYGCHVAAVIQHNSDMHALASGGVFSTRYPDDPLAAQYRELAASLA